jgi:molybdopterin adenylyltransferase
VSDERHHSSDSASVTCAVITVSDTRTVDTDTSGKTVCDLLSEADHVVSNYEIIPDDPETLRQKVQNLCQDDNCKAVILTGGTGIASRDSTIEAITPLLEKTLDGFGELFRMLSYQEIGAAAMLSRAAGGIYNDTAIFALPGSTKAVKIAMTSLIIPQLGHLAGLLSRN